MGKHRHKKSFYDVDDDDLHSSRRDNRHHRRRHSSEKQNERRQRVPSMSSFVNSKTVDDDEAALQSPPIKRQRSSLSGSQSPSKVLSQLIENPEFLANAGPKAKEFAETARQLLAKPDLDPTTQQIICAMAQAAVNVGKRLNSSSLSSTPADQCVDDISITNSTTYSSTTLLSPTLSTTSSSSASTTPQQQSHSNVSREESKTPTEPESDEDILIKQMIERAMKLTQQGDTRHAQHLLGVIHEKLSNKRKREAVAAAGSGAMVTPFTNSNDDEKHKGQVTNDFYALPSMLNEELQNNIEHNALSSYESEQTNDYQNTSCFSYPPPPLPPAQPPPPPPPPIPDTNVAASLSITVPPIEQVQELLANPSEVQDILKKLFAPNDNVKVSPPEEHQIQSHLTSPSAYYSQPPAPLINSSFYPLPPRSNNHNQPARLPLPPLPSPPAAAVAAGPQPYNSSLAFMQGNRRNLPPLQTPDRCFSSSSSSKSNKSALPLPSQQQPQTTNRSFSFSSLTTSTIPPNSNGIKSLLPTSAPPLMTISPTLPYGSSVLTPFETIPSRWSSPNEQQPNLHAFWCATCALGFPHQIVYQEHLRTHVSCNVPGCSYTASEQLVRMHYQNMHENNVRNRMNNTTLHSNRPIQPLLDQPWPLMRM
ncbi:unnamed protein product [Adineta ricciae]|uniref:C2H2-type domain-containing protein n=1 Tax=Adineta ricciae TaxID=249248 RepID=A0A813WQ40_ADIRI|nr:unnamed protein product [Adineta ricciae]CAF1160651.1 unnamed protein product [Adineta ricciae]